MKYVAGIFLAGLAASTQAAVFCVDTPQKLRDDFITAQNNAQNNLIKIVRGNYSTGGVAFSYDATNSMADGNLVVRGGFNADCSTQIMNPTLTVLDGGGAAGILSVAGGSGSITVQYLTIQDGNGTTSFDVGSLAGDVTASFNIVRYNQPSSALGAALRVTAVGTIHVDNNLVHDNSLGDGYGSVAILAAGAGDSFVTNNTVTGNTNANVGQPVGGVYFSYFFTSATPSAYFSNNIFYNNSNYGLYVNSTAVPQSHLSNNDIGTTNLDTTCCANVSRAPQFVDKVGGNFHLAATSPLLGGGTTAPMGGLPLIDLDGNPRFFNGLVDLGAYERGDVIFANGFQ